MGISRFVGVQSKSMEVHEELALVISVLGLSWAIASFTPHLLPVR